MSKLKILFAGTPLFAEIALNKLLQSSHQVIAVFTQPDRPKGRGLKLQASPVKELALKNNLPLFQPASLKTSAIQDELKKLAPDVMVVVAFGMLLPKEILMIPKFGCINVHPSLLPKFRGAAPIERTIESGDSETGVTIMQMDEGLDTGPILLQTKYLIKNDETSNSLMMKLAETGSEALIETLNLLQIGSLAPIPQDSVNATYANKITKEEALLSFYDDAITLERKVRAFNPRPVAYLPFKGKVIRVYEAIAKPSNEGFLPGIIIRATNDALDIACMKGSISLRKVQLPGKKPHSITDFYHAHHHDLIVGQLFS